MDEGYLIVETHTERPGLVCIRKAKSQPKIPEQGAIPGPRIRYIARFNDLSAARMQVHTRLRRALVDVESGLYRSDPAEAVAAADSLALRHLRVYLDPELAGNPSLDRVIARHRWRHGLADRFWRVVGIAAVVLLLLKLLFGF